MKTATTKKAAPRSTAAVVPP